MNLSTRLIWYDPDDMDANSVQHGTARDLLMHDETGDVVAALVALRDGAQVAVIDCGCGTVCHVKRAVCHVCNGTGVDDNSPEMHQTCRACDGDGEA